MSAMTLPRQTKRKKICKIPPNREESDVVSKVTEDRNLGKQESMDWKTAGRAERHQILLPNDNSMDVILNFRRRYLYFVMKNFLAIENSIVF